MSVRFRVLPGLLAGILVAVSAHQATAQTPSHEVVFGYKPKQQDVDIDSPAPGDLEKCKIEVEQQGKTSGWVAYGPDGRVLRRFVDSDGDPKRQVDQWRYYKNGLEVYRDMDTDGDTKPDQCRWLSSAGTRWGIDANGDGVIEQWKMISAEEASREAIKAIASGNAKAFSAVLITAADLKSLGVSAEVARQIQADVSDPAGKLNAALKGSKTITRSTKWVRFDSSMLMPNLVPAEAGVSERDLHVYENVMAIVDTNGKTGFVQIGEMVRVGDVWKLTGIPVPIDGDNPIQITEGGRLIQHALTGTSTAVASDLSPEVRKLVEQLQKIDENTPQPGASKKELAAHYGQRSQILERLSDVSATADERMMWKRQQIDLLAEGVRRGALPNGIAALKAIEADLVKRADAKALAPYSVYRRMAAEYYAQAELADASQRVEVQANWLKALEQFVADYPQSEDAADAMLELAMANEFAGKVTEAKDWYARLADVSPDSQPGTIAKGALRRFNLKGQRLALKGPALGAAGTFDISRYRGKVVAVMFWATWCIPCTEDLPQVQELYKQYKADGFEVLGVNIDDESAPIQQYIRQHKIQWPSIHEPGGRQSGIAQQFGVITLPTTFLVDKSGTVVSAATTVDDLKKLVPDLVKQ